VRDDLARFRAADVQPFGVNPASPAAHADYAARLGLPFPLLSDPGLAVCRLYGAVTPAGDRVARAVYLIDRDGTVRFARYGSPPPVIVLDSLAELGE
jgi:peroxiredoxin Q/BCP